MLTDDDKKWIASEISTQNSASEERTAARIERVETALLTEFHKWAFAGHHSPPQPGRCAAHAGLGVGSPSGASREAGKALIADLSVHVNRLWKRFGYRRSLAEPIAEIVGQLCYRVGGIGYCLWGFPLAWLKTFAESCMTGLASGERVWYKN